eukprot:TRINITY_DN22068_c0_g1_i2.p1 TRINITY_DN22068_c0_g1~~TRINITY_DN22068_c0_g1_i2.p1  ORF type:complete len:665 (-),score=124.04 TRINITY_DN22068_c0_g1_i2:477-2213(-)
MVAAEDIGQRAKAKAKASSRAAKSREKAKLKAKVKKSAGTVSPASGFDGSADGKALVELFATREKDWRVGPVVYQVFVDRFATPNRIVDDTQSLHEVRRNLYPSQGSVRAWSESPERGVFDEETQYCTHELDFWGGNLCGLTQKLGYVKDLGVDVVYLQPIFEAFSNHKYDTSDHLNVDPQYGTLEDFEALTSAVHGAGMKLVLDCVFNHVGVRSPLFVEATNDIGSVKRDWFMLGDQYEGGYKSWAGARSLAELRLEDARLQDYLWKREDSVVATWLARGANGWRIDVAAEFGLELLASLTEAAHRHKPGSLVVSEVWSYGAKWSKATDGVLNFHLGTLIHGVAEGKCRGPTAAHAVERLIADSSTEEVLRSWVVLSNHDMPRLATRLPDLRLRRFAQTLQFVFPGSPVIYYGDELGMAGGDDPLNRAPMAWELVGDENATFCHTSRLVRLRQRQRALRIGDYVALHSQRLLAFARTTDRAQETVIVLANPTKELVAEMLAVPVHTILGHTSFRDAVADESQETVAEVRVLGGTIFLEVPPETVRVLEMVNESEFHSGAQYKRMYGHWASFDHVKPW